MSKLNKLVTNYPVTLSPKEVENLSATLAPVVAACGGGGGGGTPIYYYGDDVNINISPARVIRLTDAASAKLNREIPTKVSDLSDSSNYQTVAGMVEYLTTANAQTTYLTKSSAAENLAPISVTGEVNTLKAASANWNEVSAKLGTAQYRADSATFLTAHQSLSDYYTKSETSGADELNTMFNDITDSINTVSERKQDNLEFKYDENDKISAINNSALAGQGGTTYTNGDGIEITTDTISISSNYIEAITSVSGKQDELAFTYNTSNAITHINGSAIAGEGGGGTTVYEGKDGVYVDGNNIGLSAGYKTQIESVSGKITKTDADGYYAPKTYTATVNALTGASGNWQQSYEVLTAYSAAGTWLTAHQPLTNYYTKSDTSSKNELSTEFAKYQPTGDYATSAGLTAGKQYAMTTTGWMEFSTPTIPDITATNGISADGFSIGLTNTAIGAITSVSSKVDIPDTTQTELNNNYLIYSTLTGAGATTGWMPLSANYYSKSEADGRYAKASAALTSVSANTPLSGNGTTANPLGFDLTNAYSIDGTNGITAVPNSTTNKVVVQMTNDVWTDTQVVHSSISAWNEVSGLSAKSTVSANTATNVISVSSNSTATTANLSATTYYTNTADSNLVAQRLFVVHNDDDLVAHVQAGLCQGQGSLFFVMSGFNN